MADVKMPESVPCKFDEKGWAPHVKSPVPTAGVQSTRS